MIRRPLAASLALFALAVPVAAESPAFALADGSPWTASGPNGRGMSLTFFPDGAAQMRMGPIRRKLTWSPTPDGLCLQGMPNGDRCVRLVRQGNGYVGLDGEGVFLTLER